MRKLLLALALSLIGTAAWAQNPQCPTRPPSDASNACASTQFVTTAVAGGTTTPPGGTSGQVQYNNAGAFGGFTFSGDITVIPSTGVATLVTVNSNVGTFGNATNVGQYTVNAKGLITAAGNVPITFPVTSVFGRTGTVVATSGDYTTAQLTTGTSGSSPSAGQLGETITNLGSSGTAIGNGTVVTLATVSLSAGDWSCSHLAQITMGASTSYTSQNIGITATPVSFPLFPAGLTAVFAATVVSSGLTTNGTINDVVFHLTTTTSISGVFQIAHSAGTITGQGYLQCVRQD